LALTASEFSSFAPELGAAGGFDEYRYTGASFRSILENNGNKAPKKLLAELRTAKRNFEL
jgi:tryptophan 2,3-dioxygenase